MPTSTRKGRSRHGRQAHLGHPRQEGHRNNKRPAFYRWEGFIKKRNEKQGAAAKALIDLAGDGEIGAIVTQFAIFEVTDVLQHFYGIPNDQVAGSYAT